MFKSILVILLLVFLSFIGCGPSEKHIRNRSVKLSSERGSCSGEQVRAPSGVDYILTAGHCNKLAKDGSILVTTEDGKQLLRRVIAEDGKSDLLLLEGIPGYRGLEIADSETREHVRTFTHGAGMPTYRTDGELLREERVQVALYLIETEAQRAECNQPKNKIAQLDIEFFGMKMGTIELCLLDTMQWAGTAPIVPGSSGGMVVNDDGKLIGVVSAGGGGFFYYVALKDIKAFVSNY